MSIHLHSKAHMHELTTTFCDNRPLYPVVLLAFFSALVWQTLRWQRSHQLGGVELAWVQVSEMTITVLVTYRPPLYWLHSYRQVSLCNQATSIAANWLGLEE